MHKALVVLAWGKASGTQKTQWATAQPCNSHGVAWQMDTKVDPGLLFCPVPYTFCRASFSPSGLRQVMFAAFSTIAVPLLVHSLLTCLL